jgi:hypothetical protein
VLEDPPTSLEFNSFNNNFYFFMDSPAMAEDPPSLDVDEAKDPPAGLDFEEVEDISYDNAVQDVTRNHICTMEVAGPLNEEVAVAVIEKATFSSLEHNYEDNDDNEIEITFENSTDKADNLEIEELLVPIIKEETVPEIPEVLVPKIEES